MKILAVLMVLACQEESKDDWKALSETWKKVDEYKGKVGKGVDDAFLDLAAEIAKRTGEKSKLPADERAALRAVFRARLSHIVDKIGDAMGGDGSMMRNVRVVVRGLGVPGDDEEEQVDIPKELEKVEKGFAGGDEEGYEKAFKSLRKLKVLDPEMPGWKERRIRKLLEALAAGKEYPAVSQPDAATLAKVDELIKKLGADGMEDRDTATKELKDLGEVAVPALRKAADESEDPEVRARARAILGIK